jgi:hypothetical protein
MQPLAKFWTWLGNYFLPLAVAWAYFVRNGPDEGVKISRGYWGLMVSLVVGTLLVLTLTLYIRKAREANAITVPPNTAFETETERNLVISWGSLATYLLGVASALIIFTSRYFDSKIHEWKKDVPLAQSFWGSRVEAWSRSCGDKSCYAMGNRFGRDGKELEYVDQYLPYMTDPAIVVLALGLIGSIVALLVVVCRRPRAQPSPNDY